MDTVGRSPSYTTSVEALVAGVALVRDLVQLRRLRRSGVQADELASSWEAWRASRAAWFAAMLRSEADGTAMRLLALQRSFGGRHPQQRRRGPLPHARPGPGGAHEGAAPGGSGLPARRPLRGDGRPGPGAGRPRAPRPAGGRHAAAHRGAGCLPAPRGRAHEVGLRPQAGHGPRHLHPLRRPAGYGQDLHGGAARLRARRLPGRPTTSSCRKAAPPMSRTRFARCSQAWGGSSATRSVPVLPWRRA